MKAVFFDVSNTLLYKPDLFNRVDSILRGHGLSIPVDQIEIKHKLLSELIIFPDKTSREFYSSFNRELLYLLGVPPTTALINELFEECSYLPWRPFSDLECLIEINIRKGILSNWDRSLPERLKQHFPFSFDWILGSELQGFRKPDSKFFEKMIEVVECDPGDILYVGDSMKLDVIPATNLGIRAVLIDRLNIYVGSPVPRIKHMGELTNFL